MNKPGCISTILMIVFFVFSWKYFIDLDKKAEEDYKKAVDLYIKNHQCDDIQETEKDNSDKNSQHERELEQIYMMYNGQYKIEEIYLRQLHKVTVDQLDELAIDVIDYFNEQYSGDWDTWFSSIKEDESKITSSDCIPQIEYSEEMPDSEYYDSDDTPGTHHVDPHWVDSYERSDGTHVDGYMRGGDDGYERSDPDGDIGNNLSN